MVIITHHHRISHPTRHQQQLLMLQSQHFHPSAWLSLLNSLSHYDLWPCRFQRSNEPTAKQDQALWTSFLMEGLCDFQNFSYQYQLCMYAPKLDLLHFILISVPWFHGGIVSGVPSFYPVLAGRSEENLERLPLAAAWNERCQATMIGLENDLLSNCIHDQKYSPRTGLLTPRAIVTCLYSSCIFNHSY